MKIEFEDYSPDVESGAILKCPSCGAPNMHHDQVEVFDCKEDKPGLHVTVLETVSVDTNLAGNPSSRRHGLTVRFWCEHCTAEPTLKISQHKGETYVGWGGSVKGKPREPS